jgi:hypothetical protein
MLPSRFSLAKTFEFDNIGRQGAAIVCATMASLATLSPIYLNAAETVLGISSTFLTAFSLVEFQRVLRGTALEITEHTTDKIREGHMYEEESSCFLFERNCSSDKLCNRCLARRFACGVAVPLTILICIPKLQFAESFRHLLTPPLSSPVNQSLKFQFFIFTAGQIQLHLLLQLVSLSNSLHSYG